MNVVFPVIDSKEIILKYNVNIMFTCIYNSYGAEVRSFRVEGLLRLAGRMRREFYGAMSATKGNEYKPMSIAGGDDILLKTLDGNDQGPNVFTVTTTIWFPFTRKKVFGFLGNDKNRSKVYY